MSGTGAVSIKTNGNGSRGAERQDRRAQLIDATLTAIAEFGLSHTTLARVASVANLSPGIVNFYFKSKNALLLSTLKHLIDEFETATDAAIGAAHAVPSAALDSLVSACFQPSLCDMRKIAVWYAFWGESRAREDYLELCGDRDAAYSARVRDLFQRVIDAGAYPHLDAHSLARGLTGIIEGLWQESLIDPENFDIEAAGSTCMAYLHSVFPRDFVHPARDEPGAAALPVFVTHTDASGNEPMLTLPAWTYDNADFHALEREHLFMPGWHVVCHVSDVANAGDYVTFDLLGERAFVVRGDDGALRAFHNVCRHRAHSVVQGTEGHCERFLQCPYHGWAYDFDGRLRALPDEGTFACVDKSRVALPPIDLELFCGFAFIRFVSAGPGVAERFGDFADELSYHRIDEMQVYDDAFWSEEIAVDWKNLTDNFLEDYHFRTGHPGLFGLMDRDYEREVRPRDGVSRLSHCMRAKAEGRWSERMYHALLPEQQHLPPTLRRRWSYFSLFPALHFDVYADKMDFFQMLPAGPGKSILRGRTYALPDDRRAMRAARFLGSRINWRVQAEDNRLVEEVQRGLASNSYAAGILSQKEIAVHGFHEWIQNAIPVAKHATAPAPGRMVSTNDELAIRHSLPR